LISEITKSREHFIQGMSRIADFWGLPKAMGALYGAIYLSPSPLTLDTLVEQVGITKGAVSINVRNLERLGMIYKQFMPGDRKDYYKAETDFWKIVRGVLKERGKNEFNLALKTVSESLEILNNAKLKKDESELSDLYKARMNDMKKFFDSLDSLVATVLALDELRLNTIKKVFGK